MNQNEALRLHKRCKTHAIRSGYPELADDFAQEAFIGWSQGWRQTVEQAFIDFLRHQYGDPRSAVGLERQRTEARSISLDAPGGSGEGESLGHDFIGLPEEQPEPVRSPGGFEYLFSGRELAIYERYFIDEATEVTIAEELGVSESRVSQILGSMKRKIRAEALMQELRERMEADDSIGVYQVEWITL